LRIYTEVILLDTLCISVVALSVQTVQQPIVQEGVENTHYLMVNHSKTCTITALVLRICTAVILLATLSTDTLSASVSKSIKISRKYVLFDD
jgi:hypothetical protein